jgi:hypothetical protein
MRVIYLLGKMRQTDRQADMNRPIRCSSLTLEREEHLITLGENTFYDALLTA